MSIPTTGETYAKLIENLHMAEEHAAMMGHLIRDESPRQAMGWLSIAELLRITGLKVTELATSKSARWVQ